MDNYTAIKNKILSFETTWLELEDIPLSEIIQAQEKKILYDFT